MKKKVLIMLLCMICTVCSMMTAPFSKLSIPVNAEPLSAEFSPGTDTVMNSVKDYMLKKDSNPDFTSMWNLFDMVRSGLDVPDSYKQLFYKNNINYLKSNNWQITKNRYTDYSKMILGMTALGKNAQNLEGHNLFYYLSDFTNVKKQGFNGPIWALIALKSHPSYRIPNNSEAKEQNTEERMITYLLEREINGGGWALAGDQPDTDITGMTIQALSSFYGKRDDVTNAVDRAVSWLSKAQLPSGGYETMGVETSESVAQVIVALSAVGIDCTRDSRFIKNGKSPMNGLYQYYVPEGGFMHVLPGAANNGGGSSGEIDGLATEQGMYATVAYQRFLDGKTSLYDLSDIPLSAGTGNTPTADEPTDSADSSPADSTTQKQEETTQSKPVKVSRVMLDYSQISVVKGKSRMLTASVAPAGATNKKVTWSSSNKKVAKVNSSGKVTGVKAGTATITVKAADGSGAKASCTVKVTAPAATKRNPAEGTTRRNTTTTPSAARTTTPAKTTSANRTTGTGANAGSNQNTKKDESKESSTESTTESGWSFDGEDYVPDTYSTEEATEKSPDEEFVKAEVEDGKKWSDKTLTINIPIGPIIYILCGAGGILLIEGIIFLIRKKGLFRRK